jgi:hypothetical protein
MRRVEEQPQWNPGVKLSQIVHRMANTIHVKQVGYQPTARPTTTTAAHTQPHTVHWFVTTMVFTYST